MSAMRLYVSNITSCFGAMIVCALLGYLASYAVGFLFYREALMFRWRGGSIDTSALEQFEAMRSTLVIIGCAAGLAASQAVFLVKHLRPPKSAA